MIASASAAADLYWIGQALALAARGEGRTSPNPRVGCLIVRDGRVEGSGFHSGVGQPHAEGLAVEQAGSAAQGATAFVNLEPCAHEGRTPPCADLLVRAGVRRVVASIRDPNPRVDGRGFEILKQAGIAVTIGPLADQARRLNAGFLQSHTLARPSVTLKAALSLDGMIAAQDGHSRWISGEPARRFARRLRLAHDAVLIGAGTLRRDDPRLTVRLSGAPERALRAVLAPTLGIDPRARLFEPLPGGGPLPRVYAAAGCAAEREAPFRGRAVVVRVGDRDGRLRLDEVLADLMGQDVQSVLVEGGARTFSAFLESGLADHAALFVAGALLGARGGTPLIDGTCVAEPVLGASLEAPRQIALGADLLLLGRLARGANRGEV